MTIKVNVAQNMYILSVNFSFLNLRIIYFLYENITTKYISSFQIKFNIMVFFKHHIRMYPVVHFFVVIEGASTTSRLSLLWRSWQPVRLRYGRKNALAFSHSAIRPVFTDTRILMNLFSHTLVFICSQ